MFFFITIQCLLCNIVCSLSEHPVLLIVSYDAFRYNYFDRNGSKFMDKLRKEGTYADYMINIFPTKTFPNHHSIATGLYAESHGVVGNSFYDPKLKEVIKMGPDMFHYNEKVVPIWSLNEEAGDGHYSGSMMWPGASYSYQNKKITYTQEWNANYDWYKRIDTVISWIKNPKKPANLIMLYFEEPDTHGHVFGPESNTVFNLLQRLDNITQYLDNQIKVNSLENKVNIIHLSDHGMSSVSTPNIIDITKYLKPNTYEIADSTPCLHVIPDSEFIDDTYNRLKNASRDIRHFTVYKKSELPSRWHFSNNRRTPPILVLADEGYGFQDLNGYIEFYKTSYHIKVDKDTKFGVHGYDNDLSDMYPFFMARGPQIKKHHKVPPFHTVDLFNLFCDILGIKPVSNNGTFANVRDILVTPTAVTQFSTVGIAVGATLCALMLVCCGAAITLVMIKRQQNITTTAALNKRFPQTFSNASIEAQHLLEPEDA